MGGSYWNPGRVEWNFGATGGAHWSGTYGLVGAETHRALAEWPRDVPITYVAFETGVNVYAGGVLKDGAPVQSPCRQAYVSFCGGTGGSGGLPKWCNQRGRCAWDLMAVVLAVRGPRGFYKLESGANVVDPHTGRNQWTRQANQSAPGNQFQAGLPPALAIPVGDEIDELLLRTPAITTRPSPTPPMVPEPSLPPPMVPSAPSPAKPSPGVPLPVYPPHPVQAPWPPILRVAAARALESPATPPWPPLHPFGSRGVAFGNTARPNPDAFQLMITSRGLLAAVTIVASALCAISAAALFAWSRRAVHAQLKKAPGFKRANVHPWDDLDETMSSHEAAGQGEAELLQRAQQTLARIHTASERDHREPSRHEASEHTVSLLSLGTYKNESTTGVHGSAMESAWQEVSMLGSELVDRSKIQPSRVSVEHKMSQDDHHEQIPPPIPGLQRI